MIKNFLKEKLDAGKTVIGTFTVIPSTVTADIISSTGFDFLVIDTEHGPIGFETIQDLAIVCESRRISPVVRVSGVYENEILKALDIGAHCIHVPNIITKEELNKTIRYYKYPPLGNRGFSPFTRLGNYNGENAREHTKIANENTLLAIHIEGTEAVKNIDGIVKTPELDILFLGLFDLSKSLGIPGEINNPKVAKILEKVVQKAVKHKKTVGTIVTNDDDLKKYIGLGIKYIAYSVDCDIIHKAFKKINTNFKKALQ